MNEACAELIEQHPTAARAYYQGPHGLVAIRSKCSSYLLLTGLVTTLTRWGLVFVGACWATMGVPAIGQRAPAVESASELPPLTVQLPALPSELVLGDTSGIRRVVTSVKSYAANTLATFNIGDKATKGQLILLLRDTALLEGQWQEALVHSERQKLLSEKGQQELVEAAVADAYARAALATAEGTGAFRQRFRRELRLALGTANDFSGLSAVRDLFGRYRMMSLNLEEGDIKGKHDKIAVQQNMRADLELASEVIQRAVRVRKFMPLRATIVEELRRRLTVLKAIEPDRWTGRLVTLRPEEVRAPVTIAIWDTGFEPRLFPGRVWRNVGETPNGRDDDGNGFVDDIHGAAFDEDRQRSTGALSALPAETASEYRRYAILLKGTDDVENGAESPEANAAVSTLHALDSAEVDAFWNRIFKVSAYGHGTAVADVAQRGNPGARLMHGRYTRKYSTVPEPRDEAYANLIARYARDMIQYFQKQGARVVNLSFYYSEEHALTEVAAIEPDPAKRAERARRIFDIQYQAYRDAMRDAPDILFVAAAGNSNENVDFVRSLPAGINLPNVLTVGAVNATLQPTSFTGYGNSIDVYANGFAVSAREPSGVERSGSGTSIATPYVTNLAAKIWTVNPHLTVADVRAIIEETSTVEGPSGLRVIYPAAAVERARQSLSQLSGERG